MRSFRKRSFAKTDCCAHLSRVTSTRSSPVNELCLDRQILMTWSSFWSFFMYQTYKQVIFGSSSMYTTSNGSLFGSSSTYRADLVRLARSLGELLSVIVETPRKQIIKRKHSPLRQTFASSKNESYSRRNTTRSPF
jgi:hypothetical protein